MFADQNKDVIYFITNQITEPPQTQHRLPLPVNSSQVITVVHTVKSSLH